VSRPTIDAVAVAAAASVAVGGAVGVALAGAGSYARNDINGSTNAYAQNTELKSGGDTDLKATAAAEIVATVVGASVAIGVGVSGAGVGAGIGIAISENRIGGYASNGDRTPFEVHAYLKNAAVDATGHLLLEATSNETINAVVVAAAVGVGASATAGIGVAGAGSVATNAIVADVKATIDGNGPPLATTKGIGASTIELTAEDTSRINAIGVGAAVAGGFAGGVGVAVSIAVSIGRNDIDNRVEASITGVTETVTARTGDVVLKAKSDATITAIAVGASVAASGGTVAGSISGAGAAATNVILTQTKAFITGSKIKTTGTGIGAGNICHDSSDHSVGHVCLDATDSSKIRAVIVAASVAVAGGFVSAAASIGVSIARNLIGWKTGSGDSLTESPSIIQAYVFDSTIDATGDLTANAVSKAQIDALVLAVSVAIAGGAGGLALTGAGSSADNRISTDWTFVLSSVMFLM